MQKEWEKRVHWKNAKHAAILGRINQGKRHANHLVNDTPEKGAHQQVTPYTQTRSYTHAHLHTDVHRHHHT